MILFLIFCIRKFCQVHLQNIAQICLPLFITTVNHPTPKHYYLSPSSPCIHFYFLVFIWQPEWFFKNKNQIMLISVLTLEGFPMNFGIKTNIIAKKSLHMYHFTSFINCSHPSPTYTNQVLAPFSRVSLFHQGANSLFFIPLSSCNPQILLLVFRPQLSPLQRVLP